MKVLVEAVSGFSEKTKSRAWVMIQVVLGSLFLAALSQVKIPFYPVPMSLQTLGIFLLAIGQGGRKAFYSALLYLTFITLGLPFTAGGISNTMWLATPTAGYLVGFPIGSYAIGKMLNARQNPSFLWAVGSLLVGQVIIYTLGIAGLMRMVSLEKSLMVGVVPFLAVDGLKILIASGFASLWTRFKAQDRIR